MCADPDREWFEQLEVCHVTRHQQAAWAAFETLHEKRPWHNGDMTSWAEKQSTQHPFHYSHGVTVWAAAEDHGHGGNFTTQENPWKSPALEQPHSDADESEDG